jgi:DNA-binding IclR family transcriptional regulator
MVAALHVHGPSFRYPARGRADAIAALVRDMAARLSAQLAHRPA